jgi:hypothetical protein
MKRKPPTLRGIARAHAMTINEHTRQIRELQDLRAEDGPMLRTLDIFVHRLDNNVGDGFRELRRRVAALERPPAPTPDSRPAKSCQTCAHERLAGSVRHTTCVVACNNFSEWQSKPAPPPPDDLGKCGKCLGLGRIARDWFNGDQPMTTFCDCDVCHGTGRELAKQPAQPALSSQPGKPAQGPIVGMRVVPYSDEEGEGIEQTITGIREGYVWTSFGKFCELVSWPSQLKQTTVRIVSLPPAVAGMRVWFCTNFKSSSGRQWGIDAPKETTVLKVENGWFVLDGGPMCAMSEWTPEHVVVLRSGERVLTWAARDNARDLWLSKNNGSTSSPNNVESFDSQSAAEQWCRARNSLTTFTAWAAVPYPSQAAPTLAERCEKYAVLYGGDLAALLRECAKTQRAAEKLNERKS